MHDFAQQLRENATPTEQIVWVHICNRQLNGVKFRRQHPIKGYIADFYCPSVKLVIEIDGDIHGSPQRKIYDTERQATLEKHGYTVIRFTTVEVTESIEAVLEVILNTVIRLS